jgi:hypothetical protein
MTLLNAHTPQPYLDLLVSLALGINHIQKCWTETLDDRDLFSAETDGIFTDSFVRVQYFTSPL